MWSRILHLERGEPTKIPLYLEDINLVLKESAKEKEIISQKSRPRISIFSSNVSNAEVRADETSVKEPEVKISSNYSKFAREAKERLSERWKMTKVAQGIGTSSCEGTLSEVLSVPSLELRPKTLGDWNERNLEENFQSWYSENNASTSNALNLASVCSVKDLMAYAEIEQSLPMASDSCVKDGNSPHFLDGSAGQEYQIGFHEYVVDYLNRMSSGEAYQPSPNSVLGPPFKEDDSLVSHCYEAVSAMDLQGLWTQLQLLKSESEESHYEGTQMVVSSDGDTIEKSSLSFNKNIKLMNFLQEHESRDFSYLLDVLEESGLLGGPMLVSLDSWHSPECLLSPSVF